MTSLDLGGRVCLITGAAGGIGSAAALRLAREGCKIVAFDLPGSDFDELGHGVSAAGGDLEVYFGDVSKAEHWDGAIASGARRFGPIDILFNNAGIEGQSAGVTDYDDDVFDKVMAVNVRGVYLGLKHVGRQMKTRKSGVIINTSSISGERGGGGVFAYTASKHAVNGMTRAAALSLARHGIRVLAVSPCPTLTGMVERLEETLSPDDPKSARPGLTSWIPMRRYGDPGEIANVVAFLASEQASFMTGALVPVDGGCLAD